MGLITARPLPPSSAAAPIQRLRGLFIDFLVSAEGRLFAEQNYEYPLLPGMSRCLKVLPAEGLPAGGG